MTFTQNNKTISALTQDSRTSTGSLTQDDKAVTTLTQDDRTAVGTLTQDSRQVVSLWSLFIWQLSVPWLWQNNGQLIILDSRTL